MEIARRKLGFGLLLEQARKDRETCHGVEKEGKEKLSWAWHRTLRISARTERAANQVEPRSSRTLAGISRFASGLSLALIGNDSEEKAEAQRF
jgi:hypothetical protein